MVEDCFKGTMYLLSWGEWVHAMLSWVARWKEVGFSEIWPKVCALCVHSEGESL